MALNPVERRLAYLCDHWSRFTADASKRLLVWQVPDNAVRIVQCFFEAQKHETEYTTGDLFVVFDTPFEHSIQYSRALKETLAGQYAASREDLAREGIAPDWTFEPAQVAHSATGFMGSLRSLGSRHHGDIRHLVAVLMPSDIPADADDAFAGWLARTLASGLPERLRLAVVDSIDSPRLQQLVAAGDPRLHVDAPDIDALQTAQETFAQEAAVGPAAVFRNLLMGLATLTDRAPADRVKAKAIDAVAFARKQGWADQEVVIAVLVSGALLKERRFDEALKVNAHARELAQQAAAAGHPAGRQLVLQTWFGEAGTLLAAGDPRRAADAYKEAAVIAHAVPNLVLAIEAMRMEAFCRARAGDNEAAVQQGLAAMSVGTRLRADARPMTTLPIAALDLMRVLDPRRVGLMEEVKHRSAGRELAARDALERRAVELEGTPQPEPFEQAEADYLRQLESARRDGNRELRDVVSGANRGFTTVFANGQELLGPQWPLATLAAVPSRAAAQTA